MFSKITDEMRAGKGNVGQPDTPDLNTADMQKLLDSLPNLAIDSFNALIDELAAKTAAQNIGMTVPDGVTANENVYSIVNAIATALKDCVEKKHTHSNKDTLDSISSETKDGYDHLVSLLDGITSIATAVNSSDEHSIPTSKATANYVANYNIKEKVINAAYPVGSVYSTTSSVNPASTLGYGTWSQLGTADSYNVYRYIRVG